MSRSPISCLAFVALIATAVFVPPLSSQEPSLKGPTGIEESGDVETTDEAALAKAADYLARRALKGHIAFDTDEIEAATGVDVESIEEQVLKQAVLDRLAELRKELPDPDDAGLAEQKNLVTLDSFDQFVATFDEYEDVPRIVLLLSPT